MFLVINIINLSWRCAVVIFKAPSDLRTLHFWCQKWDDQALLKYYSSCSPDNISVIGQNLQFIDVLITYWRITANSVIDVSTYVLKGITWREPKSNQTRHSILDHSSLRRSQRVIRQRGSSTRSWATVVLCWLILASTASSNRSVLRWRSRYHHDETTRNEQDSAILIRISFQVSRTVILCNFFVLEKK